MKIAYVSKEMPYGATEAFILPEITDHLAASWDVWLAPLSRGELIHDRHLIDRTLDAPLISVAIVAAALAEMLQKPAKTIGLLRQIRRAPTRSLLLRNLAVFPKGLWLGRKLRKLNFEHVHIHWIAAPATMGVIAAKVAGLSYSITAHRYDIAQGNLVSWKARGAQFVRTIDQPGAVELAAQIEQGIAQPTVLHMGVRVEGDAAPLRRGALDELRVAVAARLVEKKGHRYLLEGIRHAASAGVRVRLDVFGDGPLKRELADYADELGVAEQIRWNGVTRHADLLNRLRSGEFDACALTSVTAGDGDKEGIPVFLIESMGAGLPVITTANGGIEELAGQERGIVVPERDSAAIGDAFLSLAADQDLRFRLAERGRQHVLSEFEIGSCMTRLRTLIENRACGLRGGD